MISVNVYILVFLIAGSPALGLEALLLGLGGDFKTRFKEKIKIIQYAIPIGLLSVGTSIGISYLLGLDSLYLIVLTLAITLCFGVIISLLFKEKTKELPQEEKITDEEIKTMLKEKGLDSLINKKELPQTKEKKFNKSKEENKNKKE